MLYAIDAVSCLPRLPYEIPAEAGLFHRGGVILEHTPLGSTAFIGPPKLLDRQSSIDGG